MSLDAIGIITSEPAKSVAFYAMLCIDLKRAGDHEHYEGATLMLDSVALMKELVPGFEKPSGSGVDAGRPRRRVRQRQTNRKASTTRRDRTKASASSGRSTDLPSPTARSSPCPFSAACTTIIVARRDSRTL